MPSSKEQEKRTEERLSNPIECIFLGSTPLQAGGHRERCAISHDKLPGRHRRRWSKDEYCETDSGPKDGTFTGHGWSRTMAASCGQGCPSGIAPRGLTQHGSVPCRSGRATMDGLDTSPPTLAINGFWPATPCPWSAPPGVAALAVPGIILKVRTIAPRPRDGPGRPTGTESRRSPLWEAAVGLPPKSQLWINKHLRSRAWKI